MPPAVAPVAAPILAPFLCISAVHRQLHQNDTRQPRPGHALLTSCFFSLGRERVWGPGSQVGGGQPPSCTLLAGLAAFHLQFHNSIRVVSTPSSSAWLTEFQCLTLTFYPTKRKMSSLENLRHSSSSMSYLYISLPHGRHLLLSETQSEDPQANFVDRSFGCLPGMIVQRKPESS
jgi:hypothetical protein